MPIHFDPQSSPIPDRLPSMKPVDASSSQRFPLPQDEPISSFAKTAFSRIGKFSQPSTSIAGLSRKVTAGPGLFRVLANEGFYQKWIKAVSESTKTEIRLERSDKRLRKYWGRMKDRFLDLLADIQKKRNA